MDHYGPRDWQPHERPGLPGSPSTRRHPNAKRFAYGLVGLLVALTGGLGNSLVIRQPALPARRTRGVQGD